MRVTLNDMAYGGDAVGRDPESGVAVFAWPGIAGEQVEVDITAERPNLVRGTVTSVVEASQQRTQPQCPYFGTCGGCQWQHIEAAAQVEFKHGILRSQLQRTGGIAELDGVLLSPLSAGRAYNYRNSSYFAVDPVSRSLAYFRRNSHNLIAVAECPISNAAINSLIPALNAVIAATPPLEELQAEGRGIMQVWQIGIRSSEVTGQTTVVFHTRPGGNSAPRPARQGARRRHVVTRPDDGPNTDENPEASPVFPMRRRDIRRAMDTLAAALGQEDAALAVVEVMDDGTVNMLGETRLSAGLTSEAMAETLTGAYLGDKAQAEGMYDSSPPLGAWIESLSGRNYWVAPDAFFQVNTAGAELILGEVERNMPPQVDLLVDAHAGVGTFALALAGRANTVLGFESSSTAVASARFTALVASATNVEFVHGRSEELFRRLPAEVHPDVIVLDPPRSGCPPTLLREMIARQVPRIIYISCDPSTLARDIKTLSSDYDLVSARVVDMFPQTYHIETVAVLEHRAPAEA